MQTTLYDVRPYDLHAIFIPDYQFQKVLDNNFFTVFYGGPLVVEALGNCPVCPLLNPVMHSAAVDASDGRFARYENDLIRFSAKTISFDMIRLATAVTI